MTLQRMYTTVVVATPVGSPAPYVRLGQGVLGGTVSAMAIGDATESHDLLDELRQVFGTEFDRGELTVESLRPVLWAAHWLKAIRPVAQRASELLSLAADRTFDPGSKAARDCDAVGRVMASVATTEPHCLTAIEAARKIRVPADFYAADRGAASEDVAASALRVDGISPTLTLSSEKSREISRRTRDAYVSELGSDSDEPSALLTAEESQALAEQIRSTADVVEAVGAELAESEAQAKDDAGSMVGSEQSPFAVYEFPHEMREALRLVSETLGGIREVERLGLEPTPEMRKVSVKVLASVDELLGRVDGEAHIYRPTFVAHEKMVEDAIKYRAEKKRQANIDEMQAAIVDIRQQLGLEQHAAGVTAKRTYQELERVERGLMAMAAYIGENCTSRVLSAMERPA